MTLNATSGYSTQFEQFVQFAQASGTSEKTIARLGANTDLADRSIVAADKGKDVVGGFSALFRKKEEKTANDATRDLFKQSVLAMFGNDINKVPKSVRQAMELGDYNLWDRGSDAHSTRGKPLTARRILAVKAAIDFETKNKVNFLAPAANKQAISRLGYATADELKNINRTANLYKAATGCSEAEAFDQTITPGTKANRLMLYGGRFMNDLQSFNQGLKLIDDFSSWFDDVFDQYTALKSTGGNLPSLPELPAQGSAPGAPISTRAASSTSAPSPTAARFRHGTLRQEAKPAFERLVFAELASRTNIDLSASPEELFGVERNPAMRFLARGLEKAQSATILQLPSEKRAIVYDVFDCLMPYRAGEKKIFNFNQLMTGRILWHLDELSSLRDTGKLTPESIFKTCFPDMSGVPEGPAEDMLLEVVALFTAQATQDTQGMENPQVAVGSIQVLLSTTGCTYHEALAAVKTGAAIPAPPYAANYSVDITKFDGSMDGAVAQLKEDLCRPQSYGTRDGIESPSNPRFSIRFPDGNPIVPPLTGDSDRRTAVANEVKDRVVALCGEAHSRQAFTVLCGLTQSALSELRFGIPSHGIACNEHAAVDFTLSKDAKTGAITINYASPEGCPVKFSWTATVDIDGRVTTTPKQVIG